MGWRMALHTVLHSPCRAAQSAPLYVDSTLILLSSSVVTTISSKCHQDPTLRRLSAKYCIERTNESISQLLGCWFGTITKGDPLIVGHHPCCRDVASITECALLMHSIECFVVLFLTISRCYLFFTVKPLFGLPERQLLLQLHACNCTLVDPATTLQHSVLHARSVCSSTLLSPICAHR